MDREEAMKPRVLVVEDDPTTGLVFEGVLARAGLVVDLAATAAAAVSATATQAHALWLVDAHLPDGDAVALLPMLRAAAARHGAVASAVAHTASRSPALHARLRAAGHADVLVKPCPSEVLVACARRHLRPCVREARLSWDDDDAARVLGGVPGVEALRAAFIATLPGEVADVRGAAAAGDVRRMRSILHRLAAACAFVGAGTLARAVRRLHAAPSDPGAFAAFVEAADALR